ncbi:MAG: polyprenyl synthetase family protein [Planctomycetes bacterium]|nr:polyprenyl synthetase family protein [Planctomycetota bacterium]
MTTKPAARPDLNRIYEPIAAEIEEVERRIQAQMATYNGVVGQLMGHVSRFAGKRMRPSVCILAGKSLGRVTDVHYDVAVVAEMIHNATLVHDDVLDGADTRRNISSVNHKWGTDISVLFGDYLFAKAFALCAAIPSRDVLLTMAETAKVMCLGELLQSVHRYNFNISEAEYIDIITRKTAYLFGSCAELGALASGAEAEVRETMREFGTDIGIAFQIVDDWLDLIGTEREVGKTLGTDLDKGKITLPLIGLFPALPERRRKELQEFISRPSGDDKRRAIVELLESTGVKGYALDRAEVYIRSAREKLGVLPRNAYRDALECLADYVTYRNH